MRIDRATKNSYFELDLGSNRFTHYPSGDTCLRERWMSSRPVEWAAKLEAFLKKHSDTSVVVNARGEMIGDTASFPHLGGAFEVGDIVLVPSSDPAEDGDLTGLVVIARREVDFIDSSPPETIYDLGGGFEMYWGEQSNGWKVFRRESSVAAVRARRPFDGEEFEMAEIKDVTSAVGNAFAP